MFTAKPTSMIGTDRSKKYPTRIPIVWKCSRIANIFCLNASNMNCSKVNNNNKLYISQTKLNISIFYQKNQISSQQNVSTPYTYYY